MRSCTFFTGRQFSERPGVAPRNGWGNAVEKSAQRRGKVGATPWKTRRCPKAKTAYLPGKSNVVFVEEELFLGVADDSADRFREQLRSGGAQLQQILRFLW